MGFSIQIPVPGQPFSSEGVKVGNALQTVSTWGNGNIAANDLGAVLAQSAAVNQNAQTVKGAVSISTSQSTSSTSFTTLATPDQVTGIVLPANGLIAVWYQAQWLSAGAASGTAGLFLGANQVVTAGPNNGFPAVSAAVQGAVNMSHLATSSAGLFTESNTGTASTDVTTGQLVGQAGGGGGAGTNNAAGYGPCYIFAAAGTYTVSVQFKSSSGAVNVTAQNRHLWAQALSFA